MSAGAAHSTATPLIDRLLRSDFLVLVTFLIVMLLVIDRRVAPPKEWAQNAVATSAAGPAHAQVALAWTFDAENGRSLFGQTCTACHGINAQGLPHQGVDLRASKFIKEQNDAQLIAFLQTGRQPKDPKSQRGLLMPARGGNPSLVDVELSDIVAFLRQVQKQPAAAAPTTRPTLTSAQPIAGSARLEDR